MTDKITVPRATWDAMREALEGIMRWQVKNVKAWHNSAYDIAHDALTAANAVSAPRGLFVDLIASHGPEFVAEMDAIEPVGINGLTEAETSASMSVMGLSKPTVQPQAPGVAINDACEVLATALHFIPPSEPKLMQDVSALCHNLRAHHQATEQVGYKRVPVEPTPAMLYAIQNDCDIFPPRGKRIWAAMLAAAPEAKQ